jgi:hypothetical protein
MVWFTFISGVREQVVHRIVSAGVVSMCVDGWEDYAKFPCRLVGKMFFPPLPSSMKATLGFTVHPPAGRALLFRFERIVHRETADWLDIAVRNVVKDIQDLGVGVAAVIADNAANIQKGLRLSARNVGFVVVNCWSHTLNLLLKVSFSFWFRKRIKKNQKKIKRSKKSKKRRGLAPPAGKSASPIWWGSEPRNVHERS